MAFTIQAYRNLSATNVVDKELGDIVSMSGVLRKGCSIIDPVITVELDNNDVWRSGFNYIYIEAFKRYYFVTNIIAVHGNRPDDNFPSPVQLWDIHCHVDVLMSYKEQIRALTAVVARQERTYNLMLDDGFFMTYQNPKIQTKLFSVENPFETQEFVLIVAGS